MIAKSAWNKNIPTENISKDMQIVHEISQNNNKKGVNVKNTYNIMSP